MLIYQNLGGFMKFENYRDLYMYVTVGSFKDDSYREVKLIESADLGSGRSMWTLLVTDGYDYRDIQTFKGNLSEAKNYALSQLEVVTKVKLVS
jgi:hypothetical protein